MSKRSAVSLFSGCGGFCEGIELAGFELKVAVEADRFAAETYRFNFPDIRLYEGPIQKFLKSRPIQEDPFFPDEVDLVFGGPPCQGYSQIGTRSHDDERNELYLEFARVVQSLKPRLFLMENVPNVLLLDRGHYRDRILKKFESIGYKNADFITVSSADFGVPQLRQRVVFFGTRNAEGGGDVRKILERSLLDQTRVKRFSVDDAIGDLPGRVVHSGKPMRYPRPGPLSVFQKMMRLDRNMAPYSVAVKRRRGVGEGDILYNHHTKEIQSRRARLIAMLKPGAKANSLPKKLWNGTRPEKWRRLHPVEPAYTILAHMHRDLSEWVHPRLHRWITVREAARLQSFHDGFVFRGSEWQQLKQIGNAVPPLLGYALGNAARCVLQSLDRHNRSQKARALR